jgi:predicted exporter
VLARPILAVIASRAWLKPLIAAAVLAGAAALLTHRGPLWDNNLANLSPIPQADQALDSTLRHDLGVPDQRFFAVFAAPTEQTALQTSEFLATTLQTQRAGFDVPSATLPSLRTQAERQAALPDSATLHANFAQASAGMPFKPNAFAPFFAAVAAAKSAPLITQQNLPPPLALRVDSMLMNTGKDWTVIAPLTTPAQLPPGIQLVDLDHESTELLKVFQSDSCKLAGIGSLAILAVLLAGLRSPSRVAAIAAPLAAAVIVTAAILTLGGAKLSIFMVVGFLLIVAVGSNYCLFFSRPEPDGEKRQRAAGAILLANLCTVSAYGLMSVSRIPVLHDIGLTVAIGTFLTLFFGAALSPPAAA